MPRFDRTGPMGNGSQTGRTRGLCAAGKTNTRSMLGRGNGRGMRRIGLGNYQGNDKDILTQEKIALEERIKYIDKQLGE